MVSGVETIVVAGKALSAAGSLAARSPLIMRQAKRAIYRLRRGNLQLPIFGAGGVGKSTAARIIAGHPTDTAHAKYKESIWSEQVSLAGDIPGSILVAPGQLARVDQHWPKIFASLHTHHALGIINIVSYGYHAFDIQFANQSAVWVDGMQMAEFCGAYTSYRRQLELDLMALVNSGLYSVTKPIWMVTIVNKQDLWSARYADVMDYYENGPYSAHLDTIRVRMGQRFQHEFIPTSLAISNLSTGSGEAIANVEAGYDANAREASLTVLSEKLKLLVSQ